MKRTLWKAVVWLLLAPVCLIAADFKPVIPALGSNHDRWVTKSAGHVDTFPTYRSSFDTADDDDGDRCGRFVGEVFVDGRSLNRPRAWNGLAWWYRFYAKGDLDMKGLESAAKRSRVGLWSQENPIPPGTVRRLSEFDNPTSSTHTERSSWARRKRPRKKQRNAHPVERAPLESAE